MLRTWDHSHLWPLLRSIGCYSIRPVSLWICDPSEFGLVSFRTCKPTDLWPSNNFVKFIWNFRTCDLSNFWRFGLVTLPIILQELHGIFGLVARRTCDPSNFLPFRRVTIGTCGPSINLEQFPWNFRTCDPSDFWPFGLLICSRSIILLRLQLYLMSIPVETWRRFSVLDISPVVVHSLRARFYLRPNLVVVVSLVMWPSWKSSSSASFNLEDKLSTSSYRLKREF